MKKVLALVLALAMVAGFAVNSFAYNALFTNGTPTFKVDGNTILANNSVAFDVDGDEEYTIKYNYAMTDLVDSLGLYNPAYETVMFEKEVRDIIDSYISLYPATTIAELNTALAAAPLSTALTNLATKYPNSSKQTLAATDIGTALAAAAASTDIGSYVDGGPNDVKLQDMAFKTVVAKSTWVPAPATVGSPDAVAAPLMNALASAYAAANTAYNAAQNGSSVLNSDFVYLFNNITVNAKSKDETFATITTGASYDRGTNQPSGTIGGEFKVRFTNTTFANKEVKIEVTFAGTDRNDNYYESKYTLKFNVKQAQSNTFTEGLAVSAFRLKDEITISAKDYATISAGAFKVMLQNSNRSITVVNGMGDSKVKFDSSSLNLPQDVYIGNFKTSDSSEKATISGFASTATAKIKIAVGKAFYDNFYGKTLKVYDANGNALDVEAVLQGDYTVNFVAPLSSYTIAGTDYNTGNSSANTGKDNPSMGSNDFVGAAVALASLSLVAAGAVALKKAK